VLPLCTESASLSIVFFMTLSRSCFARTFKLLSSGKPESISVASWRVKIIRIFDLTFLRWKRTMPFFARGFVVLAAAAVLRRDSLPSELIIASSMTLVGK
jgi:hypothetical protein